MSRSESVIHNIGYRHYEGARLGRLDAGKAIAIQSLAGAYGIGRGVMAKIFPWMLVAGVTLPALIVLAIMNITNQSVLEIPTYIMMLQVFPAMFIAVTAPHAVSRDLRFGLMPLYFSRPITPGDYVNARFIGVGGALFLLLAAPLLVLYLAELSIGMPYLVSISDLLTALVGAFLLTVLFTGIGLLVASVTPRRGLGIAGIVAVLFGGFGFTTLLQGLFMASGHASAAQLISVLSPVSLVDGVQSFWFGSSQMVPLGEVGTAEGIFLSAVLIGLVVLCYLGLRARLRKVSSQ